MFDLDRSEISVSISYGRRHCRSSSKSNRIWETQTKKNSVTTNYNWIRIKLTSNCILQHNNDWIIERQREKNYRLKLLIIFFYFMIKDSSIPGKNYVFQAYFWIIKFHFFVFTRNTIFFSSNFWLMDFDFWRTIEFFGSQNAGNTYIPTAIYHLRREKKKYQNSTLMIYTSLLFDSFGYFHCGYQKKTCLKKIDCIIIIIVEI